MCPLPIALCLTTLAGEALYTTSLPKWAEPVDDGAEQVLFLYADDVLLSSTSTSKHAFTLRELVMKTNNLLLEATSC